MFNSKANGAHVRLVRWEHHSFPLMAGPKIFWFTPKEFYRIKNGNLCEKWRTNVEMNARKNSLARPLALTSTFHAASNFLLRCENWFWNSRSYHDEWHLSNWISGGLFLIFRATVNRPFITFLCPKPKFALQNNWMLDANCMYISKKTISFLHTGFLHGSRMWHANG